MVLKYFLEYISSDSQSQVQYSSLHATHTNIYYTFTRTSLSSVFECCIRVVNILPAFLSVSTELPRDAARNIGILGAPAWLHIARLLLEPRLPMPGVGEVSRAAEDRLWMVSNRTEFRVKQAVPLC